VARQGQSNVRPTAPELTRSRRPGVAEDPGNSGRRVAQFVGTVGQFNNLECCGATYPVSSGHVERPLMTSESPAASCDFSGPSRASLTDGAYQSPPPPPSRQPRSLAPYLPARPREQSTRRRSPRRQWVSMHSVARGSPLAFGPFCMWWTVNRPRTWPGYATSLAGSWVRNGRDHYVSRHVMWCEDEEVLTVEVLLGA